MARIYSVATVVSLRKEHYGAGNREMHYNRILQRVFMRYMYCSNPK